MIVVADSSPLISLARIGKLHLLEAVFGRVVVPQAVWDEVVLDGAQRAGASTLTSMNWIEVRAVDRAQPMLRVMEMSLHRGEAEAIALAHELRPSMLLIDEKMGRAMARHFGLSITGIIGVLIAVKRRGLDPDPVGLARQMQLNGVWIAESLIKLLETA